MFILRATTQKNQEGPTPQAPNPINWKPQTPKTQYMTPTPKPQTTINEQLKKDERINLGKMKRQKQRISDKMCIIIINLGSDT